MKDKIFKKMTDLSSNFKTDNITEKASHLKEGLTDAFGKINDYSCPSQ